MSNAATDDSQAVSNAHAVSASSAYASASIAYATPATPFGPPYRMRKDRVIWLSILGLPMIATAIISPFIPVKNSAERVGEIVGTFFGLVMMSSLIGSLFAMFFRRRSKFWPRFVFVGVTIATCVLFAMGRWVEAKQTAVDNLAAAARRLAIDTNIRLGPADVASMRRLSIAEAHDLELVLDSNRVNYDDALALNQDYQSKLRAIVGTGLLTADRLDTADHVAATREKLNQLRQLIDRHVEDVRHHLQACTDRIDALNLSTSARQTLLPSLHANLKKGGDIAAQSAQLDEQFANVAEEMINYIAARLGTFSTDGNKFRFATQADADGYNALHTRLMAISQQQTTLSASAQASVNSALDNFRKTYGGR